MAVIGKFQEERVGSFPSTEIGLLPQLQVLYSGVSSAGRHSRLHGRGSKIVYTQCIYNFTGSVHGQQLHSPHGRAKPPIDAGALILHIDSFIHVIQLV